MNDENINEKKEKRKEIFEKIYKKIEKAQKNEKIMQEILRYKYIALMIIIIISLLIFHVWASKSSVNRGQIEMMPLIAENQTIESDIKNQILIQKAEEIGVRPINNPDIKDYLNLYLQKNTSIWDFITNEQTIYNGSDVVVKAVKMANGNTVFTLNNKQYYTKD